MTDIKEYTMSGREVTEIDRVFDVQVRPVVIISTKYGDQINGMSAAWMSRTSDQPFQVMVAVYRTNFTHELLKKSGIYAINFLKEGQQPLAVHFGYQSGRDVNKFQKVSYFTDATGSPILKGCLAYLDCRVLSEVDSGDHTVFFGEVLSGKVLGKGHGLMFRRSDYVNAKATLDGPFPLD